jgi:hypothetical protein
MNMVAGVQPVQLSNRDIDSLSTLPLGMLPLESKGIRELRMIKDSKLQSAIELYSDSSVGRGLVYPDKLHESFPKISSDEQDLLISASKLHSFDVYSLRISLRKLGIEVDNHQHLCLSVEKQLELQTYIRPFTERLIKQIYGGEGASMATTNVATLFHDPDKEAAREKLKNIAGSLDIPLHEVPQFLADYGDIYMSVAYYKSCLDLIQPIIEDFFATTDEITSHGQMKQNHELMKACKKMDARIRQLRDVLKSRFSIFTKTTDEMWQNMSAGRFNEFKKLVEDNHTVLGGILCTLTVKMDMWHGKFPTRHAAGPNRRADFIMNDMRQGF